MTMKIGFIEPAERDSITVHNRHLLKYLKSMRANLPLWDNPDLGLLTVAGMVPDGWDVTYDSMKFDKPAESKQYDLVALGGMTRKAEDMYRLAAHFRQQDVYIVAGGIHASLMPEEVLEYVDTVIIGESEDSFPKFIRDFMEGKAKRVYREQGVVDMEKSPIPRYDLLGKGVRNYPLQTTRGCPRNCSFCTVTRLYGKLYRHKSVDQVVDEIRYLKRLFPNPFVIFSDDNMFVDPQFSLSLVEKLIPLGIKWQAQTDVSIAWREDLLELLPQAGCRELFVGFESLTENTLKQVNRNGWKSSQVKRYREAVRRIKERGIRIFGAFILGFDEDTPEDFARIKKFVLDEKILGQFTILTPLPGTALYDKYQRENRLIKDTSWRNFTFLDCVIKHPTLGADELERAITDLYKVTYSNEHYGRVMADMLRVFRSESGCVST